MSRRIPRSRPLRIVGSLKQRTTRFIIASLKLGHQLAWCCYWLGKSFWGRGITTAALKGSTRYVIAEYGLLRVFAVPFSENAASIRVLEKAGFVREGLMRRSAVKEGRIVDQVLYAFISE